jgi:hypothetical protein
MIFSQPEPRKEMSTTDNSNPADLFEKAAETCLQAMKEGLKMQEQFAERWFETIKSAQTGEDWSKQFEEAAAKVAKQAQANADEAVRLMEEGANDGMALFNKAMELGGIATPGEAQVKMQQLWQESMSVLNKNAKAVVQANSKMLQGWTEMAKENAKKATAKAS